MKNMRKFVLVLLAGLLAVAPMSACKKTAYIDESSIVAGTDDETGADVSEETGNDTQSGGTGSGSTSTKSNSSKGTKIDSGNKGGDSGSGAQNTAKIDDNIKIKEGSTPVENGVNYGGKTLVYLSAWDPNSDDVKEFEKTYNCKLDVRKVNFNLYAQQAAALVNSGTKIDIGYIFSGHYPQVLISGLWQPLQDHFTTADLVNTNSSDKKGIDLEKSKQFSWNKNLYGVTYYYSTYTGVLFYNKKLVKDFGAKDPMDYYNAGTWNYENLLSFARSVTDTNSGIYFGATAMYSGWLQSNNTGYIKYVNGVPTENMSDPAVYDALKLVRDMAVGQNKVLGDVGDDAREAFLKGKTVAYKDYMSDSSVLRKRAASAEAFGKNADNVGRVLLPTGPNNTDNVPTTAGVEAFGSSIGSQHPEAAILWAKLVGKNTKARYMSSWSVNDAEWNMFMEEPLKKSLPRPYGGFATSSTTMNGIISDIESKVYLGSDITSVLNRYRTQVRNCINVSMKQQG